MTTIEWTHMPGFEGDVWNPTTGCTRVSAGCDNCYAFALHDKRYKANLDAALAYWDASGEAIHNLDGGGKRTQAVIAQARHGGARIPFPRQYDLPFSRVQLLEDRLEAPLRKRKPTCYFVDSMADLFHEDVPDEFIDAVWVTMFNAPQHRFLILTKRPERMRAFVSSAMTHTVPSAPRTGNAIDVPARPLPNVWLGTSVEDQRAADERIPHLLATPAAVRFLSCEPLLGPVALVSMFDDGTALRALERGVAHYNVRLDWVIVGGESGSRARPMDLAWARSLRDQCREAGVAFFMKQLGSKPVDGELGELADDAIDVGGRPCLPLHLHESHGRNPDEWPEDLRVREWPR